jgi:hypothetical protein
LAVKGQLSALRIDNISGHYALLRLRDVNESWREKVRRDHGHIDLCFSNASAEVPGLHDGVIRATDGEINIDIELGV